MSQTPKQQVSNSHQWEKTIGPQTNNLQPDMEEQSSQWLNINSNKLDIITHLDITQMTLIIIHIVFCTLFICRMNCLMFKHP